MILSGCGIRYILPSRLSHIFLFGVDSTNSRPCYELKNKWLWKKLSSILEIARTARTRAPVFRYSHEICSLAALWFKSTGRSGFWREKKKLSASKSKIKESCGIRTLYLKVRASSTLLPEFMCRSIFLKSGSFVNSQCEFTLCSRPLIDVSIYTRKLHICRITHAFLQSQF